jgi:hypothetical protein
MESAGGLLGVGAGVTGLHRSLRSRQPGHLSVGRRRIGAPMAGLAAVGGSRSERSIEVADPVVLEDVQEPAEQVLGGGA